MRRSVLYLALALVSASVFTVPADAGGNNNKNSSISSNLSISSNGSNTSVPDAEEGIRNSNSMKSSNSMSARNVSYEADLARVAKVIKGHSEYTSKIFKDLPQYRSKEVDYSLTSYIDKGGKTIYEIRNSLGIYPDKGDLISMGLEFLGGSDGGEWFPEKLYEDLLSAMGDYSEGLDPKVIDYMISDNWKDVYPGEGNPSSEGTFSQGKFTTIASEFGGRLVSGFSVSYDNRDVDVMEYLSLFLKDYPYKSMGIYEYLETEFSLVKLNTREDADGNIVSSYNLYVMDLSQGEKVVSEFFKGQGFNDKDLEAVLRILNEHSNEKGDKGKETMTSFGKVSSYYTPASPYEKEYISFFLHKKQ